MRISALSSRDIIASLEELKGAIGSPATSTVLRKLRELDYLSSYSHRGSFYTLPSIPKFDQRGLWQHLSVGFSKHGNLIVTCQVLVEQSEAGMSAGKLNELLDVECKRALNQLFHDDKVTRRKFDGVYVYLARDSKRRRQQKIAHSTRTTNTSLGISTSANAEEVRAAIILFFSVLDEKQRRLFAGLESLKRGYGGDLFVSEWLDLDPHTVAKGRRELLEEDGEVRSQRVRRKGAGRRAQISGKKTPEIVEEIKRLVIPDTAGDPISGLKWTRRTPGKIAEQLQKLGIEQRTGLPVIGEAEGLVPTDSWMMEKSGHPMTAGDLANFGIGHGYPSVSPIQVAQMMAGVANRRYVPRPRLVQRIESNEGDLIEEFPPVKGTELALNEAHLDMIHRAMLQTVARGDGTAHHMHDDGLSIAAKSGATDRGPESSISWCAGFLPAENPKIAFAVVCEGEQDEALTGFESGEIAKAFFLSWKPHLDQ